MHGMLLVLRIEWESDAECRSAPSLKVAYLAEEVKTVKRNS